MLSPTLPKERVSSVSTGSVWTVAILFSSTEDAALETDNCRLRKTDIFSGFAAFLATESSAGETAVSVKDPIKFVKSIVDV